MHFQLIEKEKRSMISLWRGAWMAALMGTLLSLLNSMEYWWAVIPGVAIVIAVGFLPRKQRNLTALVVFVLLVVWMLLRYKPVLNGWGFLANRLLALSEESQGYYYVFFTVVGEAPAESLVVLSCFVGVLCLWLGGAVNLVLTLAIAAVIAYFGVVPSIVWLCILLSAAFVNALPKQGRWLPAVLVAAFIFVTAFSIETVAPEPNLKISTLIEQFWEFFVPQTQDLEEPPTAPTDMETPPETQAPTEPEEDFTMPEDYTIPDDAIIPEYTEMTEETDAPEIPTQIENPDIIQIIEVVGGKRKYEGLGPSVMWLIVWSVLLLTGAGMVWHWQNTKKRKQNRIAIYAQDNAEAIRGIYLYAKRWRKFHPAPGEIPPEVKAIWLEAAYSEHEMTAQQKKIMRSYMRRSVVATWNALSRWKRLVVYWHHSL